MPQKRGSCTPPTGYLIGGSGGGGGRAGGGGSGGIGGTGGSGGIFTVGGGGSGRFTGSGGGGGAATAGGAAGAGAWFEAGSALNFVPVQDRLRFEASLRAVERAGLKVSSRLLALAQRVVSVP